MWRYRDSSIFCDEAGHIPCNIMSFSLNIVETANRRLEITHRINDAHHIAFPSSFLQEYRDPLLAAKITTSMSLLVYKYNSKTSTARDSSIFCTSHEKLCCKLASSSALAYLAYCLSSHISQLVCIENKYFLLRCHQQGGRRIAYVSLPPNTEGCILSSPSNLLIPTAFDTMAACHRLLL